MLHRCNATTATASSLRRWHPAEVVEVWGEDEVRLELKPILRRVWAPKGERPRSPHHPRHEWLWVFAAAHPLTGRVFWLVLPHLAAEMMQLFLDGFAAEHTPAGKRVVLVVDGASAHRARGLRAPERLTLVGLPAYTPELNPTRAVVAADERGRGEPDARELGLAGGDGLRALSKNHGRARSRR